MAVIDAFPNVEITLTDVDYTHLEHPEVEFGPEMVDEDENVTRASYTVNTDPRTVVRYVDMIAGENFSVAITVGRSFDFNCDSLAFEISVEGAKLRTVSLNRTAFVSTGETGWEKEVHGSQKRTGKGGLKLIKFQLSDISPEDEAFMQDLSDESGQSAREIVIKVFRMSKGQFIENNGRRVLAAKNSNSKVSNRGGDKAGKEVFKWDIKVMDGGKPVGTYIFKYHTHETLVDLGIVSRLPTFERPMNPTPDGTRRVSWDIDSHGNPKPPTKVLNEAEQRDYDAFVTKTRSWSPMQPYRSENNSSRANVEEGPVVVGEDYYED